jgi:hypothetical protein
MPIVASFGATKKAPYADTPKSRTTPIALRSFTAMVVLVDLGSFLDSPAFACPLF